MKRFANIKGKELKAEVARIVSNCERLAAEYIRVWKPIDPSWPTIEGCAYLRLSTDDQVLVEKGSLEQQVNLAVAEAVARSHSKRVNYRIVAFYIEPGITGRDDDRPKLNAMERAIEKGRFRFVIMKELARVFRDALLWMGFFRKCNVHDCEVCIKGLPIDANDPGQVLQLQILAAFAEYESKLIGKRLRENIFSALVNSKKFNSTHPVLGLDPLIVGERKAPGLYQKNEAEAQTVTWVMETFLKFGNFSVTVEECNRMGVVNKNGRPFDSESLKRLLTNLKLIGCWEINAENRDKAQDRLPACDRYAFIEDFPHGSIVDRALFERVQEKVAQIENSKDKARVKRFFPLVKLLRSPDGSRFHGDSGTGRTKQRYAYYYDKANHIRIGADAIEEEVQRIVGKLVADTPEIQDAMKRRCRGAETLVSRLQHEAARIGEEIVATEGEIKRLDRRFDVLLDGGDETADEIRKFKEEYRAERSGLKARISGLESSRDLILRKRREGSRKIFRVLAAASVSEAGFLRPVQFG